MNLATLTHLPRPQNFTATISNLPQQFPNSPPQFKFYRNNFKSYRNNLFKPSNPSTNKIRIYPPYQQNMNLLISTHISKPRTFTATIYRNSPAQPVHQQNTNLLPYQQNFTATIYRNPQTHLPRTYESTFPPIKYKSRYTKPCTWCMVTYVYFF